MGRDEFKRVGAGKPEQQRQRQGPRGSGAYRQTAYVGRAAANDAGRSGYGSESVRPYLRAQLKLKALMAEAFPPATVGEAVDASAKPSGGN